jgi:hypothetical protein
MRQKSHRVVEKERLQKLERERCVEKVVEKQ